MERQHFRGVPITPREAVFLYCSHGEIPKTYAEIAQLLFSSKGIIKQVRHGLKIKGIEVPIAPCRSKRRQIVYYRWKGIDTLDGLAEAVGTTHESIKVELSNLRSKGMFIPYKDERKFSQKSQRFVTRQLSC